jgi:mercuric ion binding protein
MLKRFLPLVAVALAASAAFAILPAGQAAPPAQKTVVLDISGMDCAGCTQPVQAALAKVKGVSKAAVSFEKKQATVTYDPKQTNPPVLIKAVRGAPHMMGANLHYGAKVHKS